MISVCMATYNGEMYIKDQITSILDQIGFDDELVIQDDRSSDSTIEIIKEINDPRISLEINSTNLGVIRNFESALIRSKGSIIFLADQDDEWLPGKVGAVMEKFQHRGVVAVVTDAIIIDGDDRIVADSYFDQIESGPGVWKNYLHNSYLGCCLAFRRAILLPGLPVPLQIRTHDGWLGLVSNMIGEVIFIKTPFLRYRRHGGNVSQMHRFPMLDVLKRRILLAVHMLRVQPAVRISRRLLNLNK
jgi:hypothetical protein